METMQILLGTEPPAPLQRLPAIEPEDLSVSFKGVQVFGFRV